ncbi:hypothetical protein Tcan_04308 [Toxocara canis]|nr:hypothetical protein Tcan_04308 [Toxocara canis]
MTALSGPRRGAVRDYLLFEKLRLAWWYTWMILAYNARFATIYPMLTLNLIGPKRNCRGVDRIAAVLVVVGDGKTRCILTDLAAICDAHHATVREFLVCMSQTSAEWSSGMILASGARWENELCTASILAHLAF